MNRNRKSRPQKVVHQGRTYVQQSNGSYCSDDGSILNTMILMQLLSSNEPSHSGSHERGSHHNEPSSPSDSGSYDSGGSDS